LEAGTLKLCNALIHDVFIIHRKLPVVIAGGSGKGRPSLGRRSGSRRGFARGCPHSHGGGPGVDDCGRHGSVEIVLSLWISAMLRDEDDHGEGESEVRAHREGDLASAAV